GQLHAAEAGADVPAGDGTGVDQPLAHLAGDLGEVLATQALEVVGAFDGVEEGHGPSQLVRPTMYPARERSASAARPAVRRCPTAHSASRAASAAAPSMPSSAT